MKPADTAREAHEVQLAIYRRMSPEQKLALAIRMSEEVREVAADGIRARHPEYSPDQVRFALWRMLHGDDVFRRAWPHAPLLDP
ncbi:MAG TPA: hypothetical protein VNM90_14455 [Haliangium sp.]|nr:hypothetical protein [Haliangium sp.]